MKKNKKQKKKPLISKRIKIMVSILVFIMVASLVIWSSSSLGLMEEKEQLKPTESESFFKDVNFTLESGTDESDTIGLGDLPFWVIVVCTLIIYRVLFKRRGRIF